MTFRYGQALFSFRSIIQTCTSSFSTQEELTEVRKENIEFFKFLSNFAFAFLVFSN